MARSALLAGRAIADLIRNGFVMILLLGVGTLIGFRADTSFAGVVAGILVVLAFSFSLSWVMAMLALKVRNAEAVQTAVFLCVFPFVFASAVFVPPSTMPSWLQPFAEHQPVTVVAEAVRGLMLGEDALPAGHTVAGQVGLALAWCLGITAVAAPTAVAIYRRRR